MKTFWNILAILTLMAIAGTGVVYAQVFVDPYSPLNPFPPPTLPALIVLPSSTATERVLPPTWTLPAPPATQTKKPALNADTPTLPAGIGGIGLTNTSTAYSLPTKTLNPTITLTPTQSLVPSSTPRPTNTPVPTNTPRPTDNLTLTAMANMAVQNSLTAQALTLAVAQIYQQQTFTAATATAAQQPPTSIVLTATAQASATRYSGTLTALAGTSQALTATSVSLTQTYQAMPANPSSVTAFSAASPSTTGASGAWQGFNDPVFRWSRVIGATSYDVYWGPLSDGDAVTINCSQQDPYIIFDATASYGSATCSLSSLAIPNEGDTYYLRIRTVSGAGTRPWQILFSYKFDITDPSNPSLSSAGGAVEGTWINSRPTFNWSGASDSASGVAGYNVYFGDTCSGYSGSGSVFQSGTSYQPNSSLASGVYCLWVQAQDNTGRTAAWTKLFSDFSYDIDPPSIPSISTVTCVPDACTGSGPFYTAHSTPDFGWTDATDSGGSGIGGYQINWVTNPFDYSVAGTATSNQTLYPAGSPMIEFVSYFLRIRAIDNAGNLSSSWSDSMVIIYDAP